MIETFEPDAVKGLITIEFAQQYSLFSKAVRISDVTLLDRFPCSMIFVEGKIIDWDRRHFSNSLERHDNKLIGL